MKKLLFTLVLTAGIAALGVQPAAAQRADNEMSIRVAGWEVILEGQPTTPYIPKHRPRYYGGRIGTFEIGLNGLAEAPNAYAAYPASEAGFMDLHAAKSIQFTMNLFTFSAALTRDNALGVTVAAGFTANNYTFETASAFTREGRLLHPADAGHSLKKAKLNTFALHFPVALEVNPSRHFFFSAGGYLDLVTGGHMKWKRPKEKLRGVGANFLQAGVTLRVGFRNAYLYGSYNFTELFRPERGPRLNPYTVGIGFGL
jgi:hypothetical protein